MHMILGPAHRSQFLIRPFMFFINFNHFWSSVGYLSMDVLHVSLHILFLLKHLATNFTRELCHLFDTLEEMCLQLLLIRKIPTA